MIYPKRLNSRNGELAIKIIEICVIVISIILVIINRLVTPSLYWSHLSIAGMIYALLAASYSIRNGRSISGHVVVHSILASIITIYIDYRLGFNGWSLRIAVPIIIMIANFTMFIVTIFNYKRYGRYAVNQLVTLLFSVIANIYIYTKMHSYSVLAIIAMAISSVNFLLSIILCFRDLKEEVIKKFNI